LPQDALEVRLRRRLGPGILESIEVHNRSGARCETTLTIDLDADFADVSEVGREREQRGVVSRTVGADGATLQLDYSVEHDGRRAERGLRARVIDATSPVSIDPSGLTFEPELEPRGAWTVTIEYAVLDAAEWRAPLPRADDQRSRQRVEWRRRRPSIDCADRLRVPFERAADDLFDLRNWELERQFLGRTDGAGWIVNAGVPMFTGLFGRDSVTAGWQSALLGPRAAHGALDAVASLPATRDDAWRDAEPGKLVHEVRAGPLSELGLTPRDAYYGTQTTATMFVLALSELWHWTGDEGVLRHHRDVALGALAWARDHGDLDGDGFIEYERRSPLGLRNQGWKDSDEGIRHADGSIVDGPIATVEEQAFHFIALERMAEMLVALDEYGQADEFLRRAATLRRRWHDAYWLADQGFYALALDGSKRQVGSITSNPGHALGTGIVPPAKARSVADRLMAPDLFSGWGIRSLSTEHPSYNPFAYHLGAVWPVEQATFALGFKRYGLDEHLDRLVDGVFSAAFASPDQRLPEALSGIPRDGPDAASVPIPYPQANCPQAWSASALIQLVQIMLGLYPFAPLRVLAIVRPRLPSWLPRMTLRRLRVGQATVDIAFDRQADGTAHWRVLKRQGPLAVLPAGPPDDVTGGNLAERLELAVMRRAPGRLARAARMALGLEDAGPG
jgi:glycogen debranching enzyme